MAPFVLEQQLGQFARSNIQRIRWLLVMAILIMAAFMVIDLNMLSAEVKSTYLRNRLLYQIPIVLGMIAMTWKAVNHAFLEKWFAGSVIGITVLNYYFIYVCWARTGFGFPYEGTFVYALFLFFVIGIHARVALWVAVINSASFTLLMLLVPIYGDKSLSSAGFVVVSLLLACIARYQIDALIERLDRTNARLESLSSTDELTGLLNRRAMMDRAEQMLKMCLRQNRTISLFMIDIDHFKRLNDSYGHQVGDRVIAEQARLLKQVFQREVDVIGRYGGEEYLVVVVDLDRAQAKQRAQAIVEAWQHCVIEEAPAGITVTCSVGLCQSTAEAGLSLQKLIGDADKALYVAKSRGRNQVALAPGT